MKRAPREPKIPKAWRDRWLAAPTTPRDPDPTTGRAIALRLAAGVLLPVVFSCLPRPISWRGLVAPFVLVVAAMIWSFAPGRWLAARYVRRGDAQRAYRVMRLLGVDDERRAAGVAVAALALARRQSADASFFDEVAVLERELELASPRGSDGMLAYALLRALRGDHPSARALFRLMLVSPRSIFARHARQIGFTWLVAHHARRGELDAVNRLIERVRENVRPSRAAQRLLAELALRPAPVPKAVNGSDTDALTRALAAHAAWLGLGPDALAPARTEAFERAARAWDELATHAMAENPGSASLPDVTPSEVAELVTEATTELADSALLCELPLWPLAGRNTIVDRAFDRTCEQLFELINAHVDPVRERTRARKARPDSEEWLEWALLHQVLERAYRLGGERVRRGAFAGLHTDLTNYAVWLYNVRRLHLLAHAIFRWLLAEARHMGDEQALRLSSKNARIRPL